MNARWFLIGLTAAAVACSGPNKPTPDPDPPTVGPATPPVVQSITVPASRVETNQDITISAVVTDAETPLNQLAYVWSANVGIISGEGPTVTWKHTTPIKQGLDVVVTLTVVDTYDAVVNNTIVKRDFRVTSQAAPFRVHDSVAEVKELARKFLVDLFGNSSVPPDGCLVDFTETGHCKDTKAQERAEIVTNRQLVVIESVTIHRQTVTFMNVNSGRVVSYSEFHDRYRATGLPGLTLGDFTLTTLYENGRWWLCESTFDDVVGHGGLYEIYRKRQRNRVPVKQP